MEFGRSSACVGIMGPNRSLVAASRKIEDAALPSRILSSDGLLYVCDREGRRIQVFDTMGNFKKNIFLKRRRADLAGHGQPWWVRFSLDKAQNICTSPTDWTRLFALDRETGETLSGFGRPGHMAGEFTFLHTITMSSKGDLFTGETIGGRRVQKFRAVANDLA